ncbi:MAG: branched-chain amino acid ABC transporter permease [Candidatus Rokuibacteriota bacterium]|nr:MAG: branched-chain amino acid ABC transporter permease [Candidatus Rokubacteria bacterium]
MRSRGIVELGGPVVLLVIVGLVGSSTSYARQLEFRDALVAVAVVVALYVFVGNSGVLSFGQVSFVAVGAFTAGVMTIPVDQKGVIVPGLFGFFSHHSVGNAESLLLATGVGGLYAFLVGVPLMRLSGLAAGIATFAVLGITHNIFRNWQKIGPGAQTLTTIPKTTGMLQATVGAVAIVVVAFLYQRSRLGRQLRAAREDPAAAQATGIHIHRQRLWAFTLSGALSGFAGGLLVHHQGTLSTEDVYLQLTFLSLAMLVVGGVRSLWGAVVGALLVSGLNSFLLDAEEPTPGANGQVGFVNSLLGHGLWGGSALIGIAALMLVVLLVRPSGITGGKEFHLPGRRLRRRRVSPPAAPAPTP